MNPPVVLRIYQNDKLISVRQFLHEEQIVIGQPSSEAQVTIDDKELSPIHALIEKRGEAYYIADLGSQSGTLLNGVPILDERLQPGDQISVGQSKIEFFIGVPKPKAPPPRAVEVDEILESTAIYNSDNMLKPQGKGLPTLDPVATESLVSTDSIVQPNINPVINSIVHLVEPTDALIREPAAEKMSESEQKLPQIENTEAPVATIPQVQVNLPDTSMSMGAIDIGPAAEASSSAAVEKHVEKPKLAKIEGIVRESSKSEQPILPQQPVVATQNKGNKNSLVKTSHKKQRWTKSFAPPSRVSHIHDILKPSKGTVIEVSVAWHERVISTHHFTEKKIIYVGSDSQADIIIPTRSNNKKIPLVQIDSLATVFIPQGQDSEVVKGNSIIKSADLQKLGRLQTVGSFSKIALEQGELIKMSFGEGLFLIVRYVSHTPRPLAAPFFDLSGPEATTIFAALVLSVLLGLYTFINPPQEVAIKQEAIKATFVVEIPVPKAPQPPPPPPTPVETASPPPAPTKVEQKTQPTQSKVAEKSKDQAQAPNPKESASNQAQPGGGSQQALKNRDTKIKSNQPSASVRQGGAIKTSTKEGSQAKSQTKDISKSGIFSVFGSGGQKKETDQGYDGAGGLAGLAESATGAAGQSENRDGEGLGGKFKDTGASGRGKSNVGVSGISINTKGRGGGDSGYGTGSLGGRKGVSVQVGGSEAEFKGTIDREAVRRVVKAHQREIQLCYERALNRDPGKSGKLVLSWNVGEQGRVVSANTVKSSTTMQDSDDISNCILSKLRTWKFPEPPRNEVYEVAYPFVFAPGT